MAVKPIPEKYHTVTPYLTVHGVAKLLEFVKRAFDATELERVSGPGGAINHAEVRIGDSVVMMGEAREPRKPKPTLLYLYVQDVDATYNRALEAGAACVVEVTNQFYGDRSGAVQDPCGNEWWIATHVEDVSKEEMARRAKEAYSKQK